MPRTIFEPFRIHSIEPLRMTTPRAAAGSASRRPASTSSACTPTDVLIDLLTDSGTGAMSRDQWAAIQHGDESYAGSPSWFVFLDAVRELFPLRARHPDPPGSGRREDPLSPRSAGPGWSSRTTRTSTRRARTSSTPAREAVDLVIEEGHHPSAEHPFKGNMDVGALATLLAEHGRERVPLRVRDGDQQLGRRAARLAREPARRAGGLRRPRGAAVPRRVPVRGERVVRPRA